MRICAKLGRCSGLIKVSSVYEQAWFVLQRRGLLNNTYVVKKATLPTQVIDQGLCDRPHI